jgi:hypothetical protein
MSKRTTLWVALVCLALSCSKPAREGAAVQQAAGPERSVEEFYQHLNAGNYSGAKRLYDAHTLGMIEDPQNAGEEGFAKWAQLETRQGTIDHVRVVNSEVREPGATVDYEVVYRDGSTRRATVRLTQEGGQWKLGPIT